MEMIDQKLKEAALLQSTIIREIEESYKKHLITKTKELVVLPYKGNYECIIKEDCILIKGWEGELIINKIYQNRQTYLIKKPYKKKKFKILAVYNREGQFQYFVTDPTWGFHYSGSTMNGIKLCLGEITHSVPDTYGKLITACKNIAKNLTLINMHSIGSITMRCPSNTELTRALKNRNDMVNFIIRTDNKYIQKML